MKHQPTQQHKNALFAKRVLKFLGRSIPKVEKPTLTHE